MQAWTWCIAAGPGVKRVRSCRFQANTVDVTEVFQAGSMSILDATRLLTGLVAQPEYPVWHTSYTSRACSGVGETPNRR